MFRQAAIFIGKQRERALSVLHASKRAIRTRSARVMLGAVVMMGAAQAATNYFMFELVNTATPNDAHLLVGAVAMDSQTQGLNTLNSLDFTQPPTFANQFYYSSNVANGTGAVGNRNTHTNYALTQIGGFSGTFTCSTVGGCTGGGSGYISAMSMFWTDASGASYYVTGTSDGTTLGNVWHVYNATPNGSGGYNIGSEILPTGGGRYVIQYQGNDQLTGPLANSIGIETNYNPNVLPEINGSTLPKAALLLASLILVARSRNKFFA